MHGRGGVMSSRCCEKQSFPGGRVGVASLASNSWRRRPAPKNGGASRQAVSCSAARLPKQASKVQKLRTMLVDAPIIKGPCCHDGLSARLIDLAGFDFAFMSGFTSSASRLGAPDTGLMSYAEMASQGRNINEACGIPVIGDGDTGYGNAMNVKRTVRGYAAAGFAGILIEDQVAPKRCGHTSVKGVVPRGEAIMRIRAACDARDEGDDIVIVARTDARQAVSLDEALARVTAFAEEGADVLFIDGLTSVEEMQALCDVGNATGKPTMANMLEGGKTPILPPAELQAMGFSLVAYPLSLLGACIQGMQDALGALQEGNIPTNIPDFPGIQAACGFPEYWEDEARYKEPEVGDSK